MSVERVDHTLDPTALVHEVWLKLSANRRDDWKDARQFYTAAAEAMRQVLIDSARQRQSLKRGGDRQRVDLTERKLAFQMSADDLVALDESLQRLAAEDCVKAELVKLRFFAGLSHQEAADVLGISRATADRYWSYARVWLYVDMNPNPSDR
ncbi:MAG: ECF-type sigma factor [Fuerstiella sp.]